MSDSEFDKKIRRSAGGFLSVSGFFSTTANRSYVENYAGNDTNETDRTQSALFEIEIDETVNKFQYADISKNSAFENEAEILFTMGAVFRIQSVDHDSRGVWSVKLKLTGEEYEELQKLTHRMIDKTLGGGPKVSLASLMIKMGKYGEAQQLLSEIIDDPSIIIDSKALAGVHHHLGLVYKYMEQEQNAVKHYQLSLQMKRQLEEPEPSSLACTMNCLGLVYEKQDNSAKALECFEEALDICRTASIPDQSIIAILYNNIGVIYDKQRQFPKALVMHGKALKIRRKKLPTDHLDIAQSLRCLPQEQEPIIECLIVISQLYYEYNMFHDALETRQRALSLQSKLYTSDHIDIASSLLFIGQLYRHTKNYDQTLVYFNQCLKIYPVNYGEEHVDITQLLRKIELTTNQMNEEAIVGDGVPL
ncbi:unnamed protein product [Rotaria magnacalcarata]|uniref:Uncharacterized protein n=1 Tax=Rotaria magnacalcarata TaxID=392030 RepID=A0A820EW24_9BILA|nr:unnamed protein product [Rotaria magnacalcarata]